MSVSLIRENECWGEATPFALEVLGSDGEFAHPMRPDGGAEIALVQRYASENPIRDLVVSVSFPTKAQGERAGRVLAEAFRKVREIADEETPDPETCLHDSPVIARLSRSGPLLEFCPDCGREPIACEPDAVAS